MRVIGLAGKMGTGKTVLAKALVDRLGEGWLRRSFADALKEEVSSRFKIPLEWTKTRKGKQEVVYVGTELHPESPFMSVREVLQWWGTDVRRALDPDYWLHKMVDWIDDNEGAYEGIVIDDIRFPNEADLVVDRHGAMVQLNPYGGWNQWSTHASECSLDRYLRWTDEIHPHYGKLPDAADQLIQEWKKRGLVP